MEPLCFHLARGAACQLEGGAISALCNPPGQYVQNAAAQIPPFLLHAENAARHRLLACDAAPPLDKATCNRLPEALLTAPQLASIRATHH